MASRQDMLTAMSNTVNAINAIVQQLKKVFPQATATSSASPSGSNPITFSSSQVAGFMSVVTSSGGTYKVPLYS